MGRHIPIAYFDVTAARAHDQRGIGRYITSLVDAFRGSGALDREVTTDPDLRSMVPIVHMPAISDVRVDQVANGQVLLGTIFDLTPLRFPADVFRPWQLGHVRRYAKQLSALRQCAHLVAISESTANDARRFLRLGPASISVIRLGVGREFSAPAKSLDGAGCRLRRILYVGAASRHKNLPRLLEAHALLGRRDVELVIAGLITRRQARRLREVATRFGTADRIELRGAVEDADLLQLYSSADVLALPSLWEGFGLPALEAMASEVPVVCSDRSSLPEVVGDCARLVDPTSPSDIARGLALVLDNPGLALDMRMRGLARASRFDWDGVARAHIRLYETVVAAA